MINKKLATLLAAGALVAGALQVQAASITGTINFGSLSDLTIDGATFDTATGVNFGPSPNAIVTSGSGDFAGLALQLADFNDFDFGPVGAAPVWELVSGLFSFDLASSVNASINDTFLNIQGVGTIHGVGFEDTAGTFTLTASRSNPNQVTFSFQGTTSAVVPDGGATAMLLGLGVLGMATLRRKLS